ncbi:hypothetical protein P175DRAFT_0553619 [Aspergillus ochraceoroseus IBT 24754]|uniref:Uncharacterized protein n=2 Tax=Aspergillus ochraceoroseus TaxID=138278 RepID=A0A2T5M725_9EURO|nr:uncharacterized protein P175DRAFT_0553619 [Aspergillus ochraceoroseus IBT 24754]KKK12126.1 hypothetical protein AOCH_002662 [Aspergillus ochraceoroseus]PTU24338.1 hypothetical protein P175DRAFT_0553619 [Aspergillus ochraceoroseus IBT 24754]
MDPSQPEALFPLYHPAKPLPFELVQHTAIFFEERLYTQALTLLLNILTSHPCASSPIFVPSPQHLALAATFLVHPSTTDRAKTTEEEEAPNVSLRLLRLVNSLVGPIAAQCSTAFSFTHFESSRQGRRRHADDSRAALTNQTTHREKKPLNLDRDIALDLSHSNSVWSRAEDFWHAVGWAFNCSVLHPARWERWRIWLEFMCEILEDDWGERCRQKAKDPAHDNKIVQDSIIAHYIHGHSGSFGRNRRILRAVFADGSSAAVNEFREVFHHEVKHSRKKHGEGTSSIKKRQVEVNIDSEQYGDYLTDGRDDDPDDDHDTPTAASHNNNNNHHHELERERETKRPRRVTRSRKPANTSAPTATEQTVHMTTASLLGDMASLALRKRLLHLLSLVSQSLPKHFMALQDLYHLFVENIRPLPLPIFQSFVNPLTLPCFSPSAQTSLCEFLLFRIRETAAPDTDDDYLTQSKLEICFLPYAAATASIVDNAKMSIALEALLMLLAETRMLHVTPGFQEALECGIERRAERVQVEKRKNQIARMAEGLEFAWLIESGERLRFLVDEVIPFHTGGNGGS